MLVADAPTHPVHEGHVVNLVKARHDVRLQDPVIGTGNVVVCLSDGIVGAAVRAEAVGARLEVRFEDRFQYQL
jgi:hypothetical protein